VAKAFPLRNRALPDPYHGGVVSLAERSRAAWAAIAARFGGYGFVGPETPAFRCLSSACPVNCCRPFTVALDAEDLERFLRLSGLPVESVVECEGGVPVVLPLAEPYVLAREGGACRFLGADGRCTQYEARPTACRLYPYQVVFVDEGTGRLIAPSPERVREAMAALEGVGGVGTVPVLLFHRACPGFVGEPLGEVAWLRLLRDTLSLQFRRMFAEQPA
jgi:Fe-S-cluster containining protein